MAPSIHVVDDDPAFRAAIARLLRACGYRVALYESGDRLLENPHAVSDKRGRGQRMFAAIARVLGSSWMIAPTSDDASASVMSASVMVFPSG